jgi:hypothetical protein
MNVYNKNILEQLAILHLSGTHSYQKHWDHLNKYNKFKGL